MPLTPLQPALGHEPASVIVAIETARSRYPLQRARSSEAVRFAREAAAETLAGAVAECDAAPLERVAACPSTSS